MILGIPRSHRPHDNRSTTRTATQIIREQSPVEARKSKSRLKAPGAGSNFQFLDHRQGANALGIEVRYWPRPNYEVRARPIGPFEQDFAGVNRFPARDGAEEGEFLGGMRSPIKVEQL